MTRQLTDRYLQAKRIAMAAMEVTAAEREALLAREVGDDEPLAREVRWMIAAIESSHTATLPLADEVAPDLSGQDAEATTPRHYRLVRRLGEGGMGVVYLAERSGGDYVQPVALKVLAASAEGSPVLLERFARERQLLARLDHPGIARLLDGGVLGDGKPFLAMEYVEGERIDTWCIRHALDLRGRVELFLRVCAAVEYAHRNLIIHRDIKPANILVTEQGEPKLLDFGIARIVDEQADPGLTQTGQHALTLAYASPEQISQQPLTTAVDVYALGAVLYQLVAGRRPFQHITTPHLLTSAIVSGKVVPPSRSAAEAGDKRPGRRARRRAVPADIDAIVLKAMRHSAGERYASVGAFAADLRRWLAQRPVQARRGHRLYVFRRFVQRNRWPLAAGALLLLSVLGGLGASLYALGQARAQQRLAEQRQHQLERMVRFQQSMYDSVDIDAMGHAMLAATQRQVRGALAPTAKDAGPPSAALDSAFARVQATDIARSAFDTYVVSHTLDNLQRAFPDAPLLAADLRQSLARALLGIGSYAHAADELGQVLAVRSRLLPAADRRLLSVRADLAQTLEKQGKTNDAARLFAQTVRDAARLPVDDPLRVAAESGAARVLGEQGHLHQALARQQALYVRLKPLLPPTDTGFMRLQRDLVSTEISLGLRDRALALAQPLVALERRTLGTDNPQTLDAMVILAKLLHYRYDYEQSLKLTREVVAIRVRRLGADHPATLAAENMEATDEVYLAQDPKAIVQAEASIDRVIAARERVLGPDHPDTVASLTVKVRLLAKQGYFAKTDAERQAFDQQAIALERRILASHERLLGPDHPDTLMAHGSLASLLDKAGEYAQALDEAKLTLAGQRRVLGPDHPMVSATLTLIGDIEDDAHHLDASRAAYREALDDRERLLGTHDLHTIESASRLYSVLVELHDTDAAAKVRQRYMDPVIAMDPKTLNAATRSVRDEAIRMLEP